MAFVKGLWRGVDEWFSVVVFAVRQPLARRRSRKARISSWGPTTQKKTNKILSVKSSLAAEARTSNGGRSGKAADAYGCSAGYYLTG